MSFEAALIKAARWATRNRRLLRIRPIRSLLHLRREIQRTAQRRRGLRVFLAILAVVTRNDAQQMIAGVAYYGVLTLVPISFGVLQILQVLLGSDRTSQWFGQLAASILPRYIDLPLILSLRVSTGAGLTAALAIIGLTWGSIKLFGSAGAVVNRMWGIEPTQLGGIARLREYLFMSGIAIILLISSVLSYLATPQSLPELLNNLRVSDPSDTLYAQGWWSDLLAALLALSLSSGAFLLVYRYVPEWSVRWKWAAIAGVLAGIGFQLANEGFAFFLAYLAPPHLSYGPLAGVLVFLMWMFASAMILAIGAAFTAYAQSVYDGNGPKIQTGWFLRGEGDSGSFTRH